MYTLLMKYSIIFQETLLVDLYYKPSYFISALLIILLQIIYERTSQ